MTNLRNKVQLMGFVGKDPEIFSFEDGKKKANFSLATDESYKTKDGTKVEKTEWHNIVVWGKQVDVIATYVKKGSELAIEGKLITRKYEDKNKNTRYSTEIQLNQFIFLSKKTA